MTRAVDFDQFIHEVGLCFDSEVQMHIHAGMRSAPDSKSYRRWYDSRLAELQDKRDSAKMTAYSMYDQAVKHGEIRPLTRIERLTRKAQGHDDNPQVQAARRLLARLESTDTA